MVLSAFYEDSKYIYFFNKRHKYGMSQQPVLEIKRKYQVEAVITLFHYHKIYS
jgi:hypothetical protein